MGRIHIFRKFTLIAILITAACDVPTAPQVSPGTQASAEKIAECELLRSAAVDAPIADRGAILRGCGGQFQNYTVSASQQRRYQRVAAENPPPDEVRRRGLEHERLFSYLLLRGVPPSVANNLSATEQYSNFAKLRA